MPKRKTTTKVAKVASVKKQSQNKKPKYEIAKNEHPTTKYAKQILNGEFICCEAERQLAKKHLDDLAKQDKKSFPYFFDESRANHFSYFYNFCPNPAIDGDFYVHKPHLQFDDGMLYGWVEKKTGNLKYTKMYKQEAKGQTKTTSSAIRAIYAMVATKIYKPGDEKKGKFITDAEVHIMAVDREQAKELRKPIQNIVNASPLLRKQVYARQTVIRGQKNSSLVKVFSRETANMQGGKPDLVIIDELSSHRDSERADIAEGNLGKKEQALCIIITTAGDNELTNPAKKEYNYAKKVLSGEIEDEHYLPIIREIEEGDDIHNKTLWQKSHPFFRYLGKDKYADGLFKAVDKLYNKAYNSDDAELKRQFLIFRMNQWQERATNSYLTQSQLDKLDKCAVSATEFDKLTKGREKLVGFDFSIRRDLTAYGDVFKLDDGRVAIDAHG
ncbi:MAG: terminase large subunit, partial [Firmicutes bacterium]|nr:terminase large subunit [Bacillota bacterium]